MLFLDYLLQGKMLLQNFFSILECKKLVRKIHIQNKYMVKANLK